MFCLYHYVISQHYIQIFFLLFFFNVPVAIRSDNVFSVKTRFETT